MIYAWTWLSSPGLDITMFWVLLFHITETDNMPNAICWYLIRPKESISYLYESPHFNGLQMPIAKQSVLITCFKLDQNYPYRGNNKISSKRTVFHRKHHIPTLAAQPTNMIDQQMKLLFNFQAWFNTFNELICSQSPFKAITGLPVLKKDESR